jgi:hypothetical protein
MITRAFTVATYKATMSLSDDGRFRVLWSPNLPGALSPAELAHYHSARNAVIFEMIEVLARNGSIATAYGGRATWKAES